MRLIKGILLITLAIVVGFSTITLAANKTFFKYSDLAVSPLPSVLKIGQEMKVSAVAKNVGGYEGTTYANLFVDGILADTQAVVLKPGESQEVTFSVKFSKVGMHEVSVANLQPIEVKVYEKAIDSAVLIMGFDEVAGSIGKEGDAVRDYSGFDNNGVVRGQVEWVEGLKGKAVRTGKTGYIEIPENPSLELGGQTITMVALIRPMDEEGYGDFLTKGDLPNLKLQDPTDINFRSNPSLHSPVPDDFNNNWHLIVGVRYPDRAFVYIDGKETATREVSGELGYNDFPWNVGRNAEFPEGRDFNGYIDEIRLYAAPLSAEEVIQLYREMMQAGVR